MLVRVGAGQDGRVADRSDGHAVGLVRVAVRGALAQLAVEATRRKLLAVALHLLVGQAVDDQDDHQFRLGGQGGTGAETGRQQEGAERKSGKGKCH